MDITGMDQVMQRLQQLGGAPLDAALARALYEEAIQIMAASQPLVPVDTGVLKSTGAVDTENAPGATAVVKLSYGGNGLAPYASLVHERVDVNHPIGTHHYLSTPFYAATQGMLERLAASIRAQLGGI